MCRWRHVVSGGHRRPRVGYPASSKLCQLCGLKVSRSASMRKGSLFHFYWCFWLMANLASGSSLLWLFHACWPGGGYRAASPRRGGNPRVV